MSEIPSYAKEIINESKFYESKNIINNQFLKKKHMYFHRLAIIQKHFFFSEKLYINSKQNENLKQIESFFHLQILKKYFFVTIVL